MEEEFRMFEVNNLLSVDPNWFLSAEIQSVAAQNPIVNEESWNYVK